MRRRLWWRFLCHGSGKEDVDGGERRRRDHRLEHLDRVVLDDAHVLEPVLGDALQERADAGRMDLDADEVDVRARGGDRRGGAAHAEADLDGERRDAAEDPREVDRRSTKGSTKRGASVASARACPGRSGRRDDEAADARRPSRRVFGLGIGACFIDSRAAAERFARGRCL
jgi:hypothetical protein